jgi:hypothetical protein
MNSGAGMAMDLGLSFVPVVGTLWNGGKAVYELARGNYGKAAENATYAALGILPVRNFYQMNNMLRKNNSTSPNHRTQFVKYEIAPVVSGESAAKRSSKAHLNLDFHYRQLAGKAMFMQQLTPMEASGKKDEKTQRLPQLPYLYDRLAAVKPPSSRPKQSQKRKKR